ncbi:MAG: polysaccharide pyruvyl transferase family protein [Parachlamydiales bacterium]|nr:polysaccharide pyruvyl transferase family protein [Parachlamydiales bacterium]
MMFLKIKQLFILSTLCVSTIVLGYHDYFEEDFEDYAGKDIYNCNATDNDSSAETEGIQPYKPPHDGIPLYFWREPRLLNFGDHLSHKVLERILNTPVRLYKSFSPYKEKKILAVGSILSFAATNDVIWGTGLNGKLMSKKDYAFTKLDVRAVRGPLTRRFLMEQFQIYCPEIYGDPVLLMPYLFPEFKRAKKPKYDYIIVPHYKELKYFPKDIFENVVYPTEPWYEVVLKILDSKFVIASSLHGLIVAEAYGIPARMLRITECEYMTKYVDYYYGTNRPNFQYATSIEDALLMGGEIPFKCDLQKLYDSFPWEFWPYAKIHKTKLY